MQKIYLIAIFMLLPLCSFALKWDIKEIKGYDNSMTWTIIECSDSLNIIMVGNEINGIPRVIKSTDGGESWTYKLNASIKDYMNDHSLKFTEPFSAYYKNDFIILFTIDVVDWVPYIIRSFNGGEDWETFKIDVFADYRSRIYFEDNFGIIVYKNKIYKSIDYGGTWELLLEYDFDGINGFMGDIRFNSINEFSYIISDYNAERSVICKTYNMGESWEITDIPHEASRAFAFCSDDVGWIASSRKYGNGDRQKAIVYKTIDGGKNWDKVLETDLEDDVVNTFGIFDIECINDSSAIIVGSDRIAAMTTDGGKTWELVTEGLREQMLFHFFKEIKYIKPNVIIAGGRDHLVGKLVLDMPSSVATVSNDASIAISPNPATEYIEFDSSSLPTAASEQIEVYNILGEKVLSAKPVNLNSTQCIDISHLPAGMYFIKVGSVYDKFIKK